MFFIFAGTECLIAKITEGHFPSINILHIARDLYYKGPSNQLDRDGNIGTIDERKVETKFEVNNTFLPWKNLTSKEIMPLSST